MKKLVYNSEPCCFCCLSLSHIIVLYATACNSVSYIIIFRSWVTSEEDDVQAVIHYYEEAYSEFRSRLVLLSLFVAYYIIVMYATACKSVSYVMIFCSWATSEEADVQAVIYYYEEAYSEFRSMLFLLSLFVAYYENVTDDTSPKLYRDGVVYTRVDVRYYCISMYPHNGKDLLLIVRQLHVSYLWF